MSPGFDLVTVYNKYHHALPLPYSTTQEKAHPFREVHNKAKGSCLKKNHRLSAYVSVSVCAPADLEAVSILLMRKL